MANPKKEEKTLPVVHPGSVKTIAAATPGKFGLYLAAGVIMMSQSPADAKEDRINGINDPRKRPRFLGYSRFEGKAYEVWAGRLKVPWSSDDARRRQQIAAAAEDAMERLQAGGLEAWKPAWND